MLEVVDNTVCCSSSGVCAQFYESIREVIGDQSGRLTFCNDTWGFSSGSVLDSPSKNGFSFNLVSFYDCTFKRDFIFVYTIHFYEFLGLDDYFLCSSSVKLYQLLSQFCVLPSHPITTHILSSVRLCVCSDFMCIYCRSNLRKFITRISFQTMSFYIVTIRRYFSYRRFEVMPWKLFSCYFSKCRRSQVYGLALFI